MNASSTTTTTTIHSTTRGHSVHPLLQYDPDVLSGAIQLVKLEYLEAETTKAPVPRNQEVPEEAFGTLNGRSILVATSHAWFFQNHPDPHGEKLQIMRKELFPALRERYPRTQILIFDDWHSCPQWPRLTQEENDRFKKCMDHMNSVYCYCDVVLFVEAPLPDLDNTVFTCDLIPSEHKWLYFIDTIQYLGGNDKNVAIQKNDIIVEVNNSVKENINVLKKKTDITTISYLKRPYGRPNRIPAEERGWLYAERITVAIRMAAAKPEVFDDVVMSNNLDLIIQICGWSNHLRNSARKEKKHKGSIAYQLELFRAALGAMKFTFPNDHKLVNKIMTNLVKQFKDNWDEEIRRQTDMATRTRELLLRWGCFSEDYVEKAELLCNSKNRTKDRMSWILLAIIVGVVAPMTATLPYLFELEQHGEDPSREGLVASSLWLGSIQGYVTIFVCAIFFFFFVFLILIFFQFTWICSSLSVLLLHAMNLAFAKIPSGAHTVYACVALAAIVTLVSVLLRASLATIVPFEALFIGVTSCIVSDIVYGMIKFIPVKDKRTGQTKRWAIGMICLSHHLSSSHFSLQDHTLHAQTGTWLHMPASHRFNPKARGAVKRNITTTYVAILLVSFSLNMTSLS